MDIRLCKISDVPATDELLDLVITKIKVAYPISWIVPIATNRFRSASAKSINVLKITDSVRLHTRTNSCVSVSSGSILKRTAEAVFTKNPLKNIEKEVDASTCTFVIQ